MLEGRWISPEPLAAQFEANATARQLGERLARQPRRLAAVVTPSDVARAVTQAMQPAPRYRVRWIVTAPAPGS
jgi:hypothetical protein